MYLEKHDPISEVIIKYRKPVVTGCPFPMTVTEVIDYPAAGLDGSPRTCSNGMPGLCGLMYAPL
jgi:hypothetical protein